MFATVDDTVDVVVVMVDAAAVVDFTAVDDTIHDVVVQDVNVAVRVIRLGEFLKFLGANFLTKVAQLFWQLAWLQRKVSVKLNCCGPLLGNY